MDNLNKPNTYSDYDKSDMLSLLLGFPNDIERATGICRNTEIAISETQQALALLGMGGSGIAGRLFAEYTSNTLSVPAILVNTYDLPATVNDRTLAIALSFSGNTAETLAVTREALERGADVVAITSGGELARICESSGAPVIEIPGGRPPRTALAFLSLPIFEVAKRAGLISEIDYDSLAGHANKVKRDIEPGISEELNPAKRLARAIYEAEDVKIYGVGMASVAATRLRGQLAENSKAFASEHAFPEMCHNELVPFAENDNRGRLVIMLRANSENAMLSRQLELSSVIMREQGVEVLELRPGTDDSLNGLLELIYIADFTSYYLAILRGQDPTAIDNIVRLKDGMAGS
ncbi:MAG: bifunctional phosphoglucose/phosphomannose isomerase [bacterium]|nr:bifunctional phosphoglucose/phosphomannose isomerase [bacterium]